MPTYAARFPPATCWPQTNGWHLCDQRRRYCMCKLFASSLRHLIKVCVVHPSRQLSAVAPCVRRSVVGPYFACLWIGLLDPVVAVPGIHASPILVLKGCIADFQSTGTFFDPTFQAASAPLPLPHRADAPHVFIASFFGQQIANFSAVFKFSDCRIVFLFRPFQHLRIAFFLSFCSQPFFVCTALLPGRSPNEAVLATFPQALD